MVFIRKITVITLLTILIGSIYLYQHKNQSISPQNESQVPYFTALAQPADNYVSELLKNEEKKVWNDFSKFGITQELFNDYKQEFVIDDTASVQKYSDPIALSDKTITLIKKIAQTFELNPNNFTICSSRGDIAAASTDTTIMVNEKTLQTYKPEVQMFIIAHELQHLVQRDFYHKCLIKQIISDKKIDWQEIEPIYNNFIRFTELRADLKTAIKNLDYASAYISSAEQLIREQGNYGDAMHPYPDERLQLANNIVKHMTTQKTA